MAHGRSAGTQCRDTVHGFCTLLWMPTATKGAVGSVLVLLASAQFLMTLDASVMNVSIADVARDLHTTTVGIQTAITMYTLVMASLMLTGAKIGAKIGRKRALSIGLVIYAAGSGITSISPNLGVLLFGWSFLEGVGAALILPAIVALVAANFPRERRSAAYGAIAAAGAIAITVGPILGGAMTSFASWRYVFVGEVVVAFVILLRARKITDSAPTVVGPFDWLGSVLSVVGLSAIVFGVLKSSTWGFVRAKPGGPSVLGLSPVILLVVLGLFVLWLFSRHEANRTRRSQEPLLPPGIVQVPQVRAGLFGFGFQFFVQAGLFFVIPVYLSIVCGLSAFQTGLRLLPLSVSLLLAALLIPRVFPRTSSRLIVRIGFLLTFVGTVVFLVRLDPKAGPEIVALPMFIIGLGIGALASQLGAVTVSGVDDDRAGDVGGVQNTVTNLGASLGTALAGSILFSVLAANLLVAVNTAPGLSDELRSEATVTISQGVAIVSDEQLAATLSTTDLTAAQQQAVIDANSAARLKALRAALLGVAVIEIGAIFAMRKVPKVPVAATVPESGQPPPQ